MDNTSSMCSGITQNLKITRKIAHKGVDFLPETRLYGVNRTGEPVKENRMPTGRKETNMTYRILVSDRKTVVDRMEAIAGERPAYTRVPRCAYILRGIAVEKDGTVTTEEDADMEIISQLEAWNMIEAIREETAAEETAEDTLTDEGAEDDSEIPETGDEPEEEPDGSGETETEQNAAQETPAQEPVRPAISVPLNRHTADSIRNLVFTLYSKGSLMSKATQGRFGVKKEFVDELAGLNLFRLEDALAAVREAPEGSIMGLTFEEDRITFDGFPATDDADAIRAWTALAAAINRNAITKKRVLARETDETNEKFAFRVWITRLGMDGSDLKAERAILYRNLSGHTAFRTPADQEKWTQRQKAKKEQSRARLEAAGQETGETAENEAGDGAEE